MVYIMRVLIVDDNQDITGLLSKFLKAKGFDNGLHHASAYS